MQKYLWFVEENAAELTFWTADLSRQLAHHNVPRAQSRYAIARVQFGQIEPIVALFPSLTAAIDQGRRQGFHRIEQSIFGQTELNVALRMSERLLANTRRLKQKLEVAEVSPAELIAASRSTLEDSIAKELSGEAEPYSHLDMVDVSANVEAVEIAYQAVRPMMMGNDLAPIAIGLEDEFIKAYDSIEAIGFPARVPQPRPAGAGTSFTPYKAIDRRSISAIAVSLKRITVSLRTLEPRLL